MKKLNMTILYLCACISLSAQTLSGDSTAAPSPPRMSFEKADSLLIALSREKSGTGASSHRKSIPAAGADTVTVAPPPEGEALPPLSPLPSLSPLPPPSPAETSVEMASATDSSATAVPATVTATASVSPSPSPSPSPEKSRKKAKVVRDGLLIGQAGGTASLKDGSGVNYSGLRSVNEGTLIGVGGYRMKDTYLTPEKYGGVGFRFMNERMRLIKSQDSRVSRQNTVNVDISSTMNGAENANFLAAFVDYSLGYHYLFRPLPHLSVRTGGSVRGMLGMVYNTRNGNNPMTVHADVDLNLSVIAIYEFHIWRRPLAIRYQFETPFAGMLFSPVYSQSYYEIFSLGNTAETINFNSFNNKFAMRNYFTLDFPVAGMTVRAGYFGLYYSTHVHDIDRYIISHNMMLGFVKEFVAFGGREMRNRNLFHSAYY
jgi:hypothetical protein